MSEVVEENKFKVDYNNIKTVNVKKSNSKFKTFTNGTAIPGTDFQQISCRVFYIFAESEIRKKVISILWKTLSL